MTLFYSWENNIPNQKNMLEKNIRNALKRLKKDDVLDMDFDRDTKNKSGAVNIADTILKKISNCSIFIADVSFVKNNWFAKNIVNQNVLFELGYAVKKLGYEKIILIFNIERGKIEDLPFDIRQLRILSFSPKKQKELENDIYASLKLIYENCDFQNKYDNWEQHDIDVYKKIMAEVPKDVPGYFCLMCDTLMYTYDDSRFIHHVVYAIDDVENHFINPDLQKLAHDLRNCFNELYGFMAFNFFEDDNKNFWMGEDAKSDYKIYHIQFNEILDKAEAAYKAFVYKATELFGI